MKRITAATALAVASSLFLTACDPPMPPEVIAALAEQSYTCEPGEVNVWAVDSIASVATDWQSSVVINCPEMSITPVAEQTATTQLQISNSNPVGSAFDSVPFAVDAIVFAYNLDGVTGLNLDAAAIEEIYSGQITVWNDPLIAKLNPSFNLPSQAISFANPLTVADAKPMTDWLSRLAGHSVSLAAGSATLDTPGAIVATTFSAATAAANSMANIVTGKKIDTDFAVADSNGLLSAASQWKTSQTATGITVELNPQSKPIPPLGLDAAPNPYQAIVPVNLNLVGDDNLNTRAAARYLLRQDSQGSLALSSVVPLPEVIRVISLTEVSKGLPTPKVTQPTG